jgi:hypothetical protein
MQTDTCQAGVCVGANPVVCEASGQCRIPGECDPATGECSTPPKTEGVECDDGNACTRTDTCVAGECVGTDPVVCKASDQCHDGGVCDPATGACSDPAKPSAFALTFPVQADSYTEFPDVGQPAQNFGTSSTLRVDALPPRTMYLRFTVSGIDGFVVESAILRLETKNDDSDGSDEGGIVRRVSNNNWDELTITDANRPLLDGAVLDRVGPVNPSSIVDFDVTAGVTGDGVYTFGIESDSTNVAEYRSRDGGSGWPELIVTLVAPCDDGNPCTSNDACIAGQCVGDLVDDADGDGFCDVIDLCPEFPNPDQWDMDHDLIGDLCQCNVPAPGRCIAGGGSKRTDCLLEVITTAPVRHNRTGTKMKRTIQCLDGSPHCDADGARDGQCTFTMALCFGNPDPRYPTCTPGDIRSIEVMSPRRSRKASAMSTINADRLEETVADLGLEVRRGGVTIAESIAPLGDGICGPAFELVTPAPKRLGAKPVKRKFKIKARGMDGRVDMDRFTLMCK